jgi:lipid-A-disaccharide synthase
MTESPGNSKLKTRNLLFSAGDLSGDIHMARLVREVRARHPDWTIHALGGAHQKDAGANILENTSGYGVIGIGPALKLLPGIPRLRRKLVRFLQTHQIAAVVLCDWGAFHIHLLRLLQEFKVPVLYYFPPRSWQKGDDGGLHIVPYVERVATPFEWSADRLKNAGCNAEWVGHPLLEIVEDARKQYSRTATRRLWGASDEDFLVAILPGSREMELKLLAPTLAHAARLLGQKHSRARFVVAAARGTTAKVHSHFARAGVEARIVEDRAGQVLLACDAAWVKSGTATLEAAVCDAPQLVVYDIPLVLRAQWILSGMQSKVKMIGMPNIIAGRKVIPEILCNDFRAPRLAAQMSTLLTDESARGEQRDLYDEVRAALGARLPYTATHRTADILEEMMNEKSEVKSQNDE